MRRCPSCAAQVLAQDRFCPDCGKPIAPEPAGAADDTGPAPPEAALPIPPRKRSWRKLGCGCLAALALAVALIFGIASWATKDAKAAASGHLNLIKAGHVDLAHQQTSPDMQAMISSAQYQELVNARPLLRHIEKIGFPRFERKNDVADLTASLRFAGGLTAEVPMRLRKEEGQWRLIAIDLGNVPTGDTPATPPAAPQPAVPTVVSAPPAAPQPAVPKVSASPAAPPPAAPPAAPAEALAAARNFINLISAGEVELSYRRASPDLQATTPLKSYLAVIQERSALRDTMKVDFSTSQPDANGTLILRARLETTDGRRFEVPLRLRNESGQWRVLAVDWSNVPVTRRNVAPQPQPAVAAPRTQPRPADAGSAVGEKSVGTVVIGAGRNQDGTLVRPGMAIPSNAARISADIQLVNHTAGDRVRVWVERTDGSARTEAIEASIAGQGTGYMPFELKLGDDGIPVGAYRLIVMLGEDRKFATDFNVR